MKKVVRIILIISAVILGVGFLAILTANLYIQSKTTQEKIERKLSETLHMPLKIDSTSFTPWGGLSVTGIKVPQAGAPEQGDFLDAQECSIYFRILPLFQRKLVINQVLISEPKVVWKQNAGGRWGFPEPAAPPPPVAEQTVQPAETPQEIPQPSPEASPSETQPVPPTTPATEQVKPFEVVISRLKIHNGSFDFSDVAGHRVALFSNVNVLIPSASLDLFEGKATCGKISFRDKAFAEDFQTHFSFSGGLLALSGINTGLAEGSIDGAFTLNTAEPKSPFTADVKFNEIDLNRLITQAGGPMNQALGSLSGYLDIYGMTGSSDTISGAGRVVLSNGRVNQYEILQVIGKFLHIEEFSQLNLERANAAWRIVNGVVLVDEMVLQTANLQITAHGSVQLDGLMDLDARLAVNQVISSELPEFIEKNFKPIDNSDMRYVDFKIFGNATHPSTDLRARVLGGDIEKNVEKFEKKANEAVGILNSLFGGKKHKNDTPPPAPAPSPGTP